MLHCISSAFCAKPLPVCFLVCLCVCVIHYRCNATRCTSINSDLWTTSSFNTLSPQQRYRCNPWSKARLLRKTHQRRQSTTGFAMEEFTNLLKCKRLKSPFEPGCPQHSPGGCQMLPDDTSPPQRVSFPAPWPAGPEAGLLSSVCCDYRGHFSGTPCSHKATLQLSTVPPALCPCPQGTRVLLTSLFLCLPSPSAHQLKGDIYRTGW